MLYLCHLLLLVEGFSLCLRGENCKNISVNFTAVTGRCRIRLLLPPQTGRFARKPNISWHKNVRETLNPKTPSCSFISLFNRVLFPAPEGPLSTTGLGPDIVLRATDGRRRGKRDLLELEICTAQQSVHTTRFTGGELWCLSGALP